MNIVHFREQRGPFSDLKTSSLFHHHVIPCTKAKSPSMNWEKRDENFRSQHPTHQTCQRAGGLCECCPRRRNEILGAEQYVEKKAELKAEIKQFKTQVRSTENRAKNWPENKERMADLSTIRSRWLRRRDSNPRPTGYELTWVSPRAGLSLHPP